MAITPSSIGVKELAGPTSLVDNVTVTTSAGPVKRQVTATADPEDPDARVRVRSNAVTATDHAMAMRAHALGEQTDPEALGDGSAIALLKRVRSLLGDLAAINPLTDAQLRTTDVPVVWPDIAGAWDYESGTLSSAGSISTTGRCVGLRLYAFEAGSVTINGGDVMAIREGTGLDVNPRGQLIDPVVAWVSGTVDVFIEVLT